MNLGSPLPTRPHPPARSPRVAARQVEARERILEAARTVIAEHGFAAAQVAVVAANADVATGSIYRHFPSKAELFSEMMRGVCRRELEVVRQVLDDAERSATSRLGAAAATFVDRGLRGESLSYAVLAEPTSPGFEQIRLQARRDLADAFAAVITEGIASGELREQNARINGAAIVGAFLECLVAPLAAGHVSPELREEICAEIAIFCRNAVTGGATM